MVKGEDEEMIYENTYQILIDILSEIYGSHNGIYNKVLRNIRDEFGN